MDLHRQSTDKSGYRVSHNGSHAYGDILITIKGANYPSEILSSFLFSLEGPLDRGLEMAGLGNGIRDMLVSGMYRVLAWVVSVMLPQWQSFSAVYLDGGLGVPAESGI